MSRLKHVLISASAGTGKTFQLTNRYISLLHRGVGPDQILATTFTRKAAGEILDRVIQQLAKAACDDGVRQDLARWIGVEGLTARCCHELLRQMLRHLHRVRISTLDSFFAQLAGSFSLELGVPPGWRIVEESYERSLRDDAIARTLQRHSYQEVQRILNLMAKGESQQSVSGLVRQTVEKLYNLYMETEAAAWQRIAGPEPLDDAQLAGLIEQLRAVPDPPADKKFCTARDADAEAAEKGNWELFISRGIAAKVLEGESKFSRTTLDDGLVSLYRQLLQQASSVLVQQLAWQTAATYELLDKFHAEYRQLKQQTGALRFDDITRALGHGERLGDIDQQHYRLDTPVAHLLLDEFQDTSLMQWQVLQPLANRLTSDSGTDVCSFLCVGDTKQAIYAWRGGKSEIFDGLPTELANLTDERLCESYRSAQPVIDAVNRICSSMLEHDNLEHYADHVAAWCQRFPKHSTARGDLSGYVRLLAAREAEEDEDPDDAKFAFTAEQVQELASQAPGCSIGVLTRRNEVVKRMINELRQRGAAASEEGGNPLTDSLAGQVILSLLRMADHPGDLIARFHVAQSPLAQHINFVDHTDTAGALAVAGQVREQLLHAGYGAAIEHWAELLAPRCDARDAGRLQQFVDLAYAYEPLATLRTADFQRHVEMKRVVDPTSADVRVMTVHQAKGLQFDIVVLPDLDGPFPGQPDAFVTGQPSPTAPIDRVCMYRNQSIQLLLPDELQQLFAKNRQQAVEEALCVLYVALTRAVHCLYMIVKPSPNEKNLPKTCAGLLRGALTQRQPLAGEQIAYEDGDAQWYKRLPSPAIVTSDAVQSDADRPVLLAPMQTDSRLDFVSPSQLEGGAVVSAASVLNLGGSRAKARGTLIHALFEQIDWLDDGPPAESELRRVAQSVNTTGLEVDEQLDAFRRMLDVRDVQSALLREYYQSPHDQALLEALAAAGVSGPLRPEVHNERRFAVLDDGHILSGSIDRLVLLYDGDRLVAADVVDYKTDAIEPRDQARLVQQIEFYRPQLQAYCRAVSTMYRLPPRHICAQLLFVSAGAARRL